MRPYVPPNLLGIVDAVGPHQQADVVLKLRVALKRIGNPRPRKILKHLGAVALVTRVNPQPERRIRRQRHDVRQKVPHRIHDANRRLAVLNAYVHMQAKDQVGARHQLQVLHHLVVARVGINLLRPPVCKRMRCAGHQHQPMFFGQLDHLAAQLVNILARLVDVAADARAHLHHRGVHLRLHPLLQPHLAHGQHLGLDVRAQIAGDRVNGLVLLFNAERERWAHMRLLRGVLWEIVDQIPEVVSRLSGQGR